MIVPGLTRSSPRQSTTTLAIELNQVELWYAVIALVALGWRRLTKPPLLPLTAVTAAGLCFLFFVFAFTEAGAWLADLTTANRATLHIVPLLVFLAVLTWHSMTLAPADAAPSPPLAAP